MLNPADLERILRAVPLSNPKARIEDYVTSERIDAIGDYHNNQPGDPLKAVRAMIDVVEMENPPLRLPLGEDAVENIEAKLKDVQENVDQMREVAIDTKVDEEKAAGS